MNSTPLKLNYADLPPDATVEVRRTATGCRVATRPRSYARRLRDRILIAVPVSLAMAAGLMTSAPAPRWDGVLEMLVVALVVGVLAALLLAVPVQRRSALRLSRRGLTLLSPMDRGGYRRLRVPLSRIFELYTTRVTVLPLVQRSVLRLRATGGGRHALLTGDAQDLACALGVLRQALARARAASQERS